MKKHIANSGFSLIELMVTVLVIAILVSIAVPTYQNSVRKARRTDARSALVDLQAREERYFTTHPSQGYTTLASDLGYAASGATTDLSTAQPLGTSGYYTVQIAAGSTGFLYPSATATGTYIITATAVNGQLKDTGCRTFTLNESGLQGATDSGGTSGTTVVNNCWK
jgi:type IV pilus assembly protein PilE